MGRVQEAIRRAAGEAPKGTLSVADLAAEPFPQEADEKDLANAGLSPGANVSSADEPAGAIEKEIRTDGSSHESVEVTVDPGLAHKIVTGEKMMPASREQYRRLAAALLHAQEANDTKVVMVASASVGEGKSLTATNLALTFSESYKRHVLLIDGDLRRPSLHKLFSLASSSGLSHLLMSAEESRLELHDASARLAVLPAGLPNSDPMSGLTSKRMRRLIEEARASFDWVFIDTPPHQLAVGRQLAGVDGRCRHPGDQGGLHRLPTRAARG